MFVFQQAAVFERNRHMHAHSCSAVTLCVLVIVPPEWSDLVLTTHIPHSEADVLVLNSLHIESYTMREYHKNESINPDCSPIHLHTTGYCHIYTASHCSGVLQWYNKDYTKMQRHGVQ